MLTVLLLALALQTPAPLMFGAPIAYHNMTIVPVTTSATGPFTSYTLLEEGLLAKTLRVRELGGATDVQSADVVEVKNTGKDAVFLLGGEVILGGGQDRILQTDAILPPEGKWVRVPVFCVEHGRSHGQRTDFAAGGALVHGRLAQAAMSGDQSGVWAEVARKNAALGTSNDTDTYRRTVQDRELRERIATHRAALKAQLPRGRLAGFVFAVNGEVRVADLFGNPVLLDALQDKLLSAYILEALEHDVDPDAPPLAKDAAKTFVDGAMGTASTGQRAVGRSQNTTKESADVIGIESKDAATGLSTRGTYVSKKRKK